jgi:predicted ribosomally synthesized peptide with SipW-like signal peptide
MQDDFELSRRKALAALGTIGVASAGAGLGTSAYFSDQETFENNSLTAGTLDMKVDWEEHYSDWSDDEDDDPESDGSLDIQMDEPDDPSSYTAFPPGVEAFNGVDDDDFINGDPLLYVHNDDVEQFMTNTSIEAFPDEDDDGVQDDFNEMEACEVLADVGNDDGGLDSDKRTESSVGEPLVNLSDVKPGDFGEVTFSFHLCDNPGYVWLNGELIEARENGVTEPEADDPDEEGPEDEVSTSVQNNVELLDEIQTAWWYDADCNNLTNGEATTGSEQADVVIVMDTSGSMSGGPLSNAKTGAKALVDAVGADVNVGLVSFEDAGDEAIEANLDESNSDVKTAIDNLSAGGSTAIGAGIDLGQDLLTGAKGTGARSGATKYLVVLADGGENEGTTPRDSATTAKDAGTTIYSIAYGSGADNNLMEDISSPPKVDDGTIDDQDEFAFVADTTDVEQVFSGIGGDVTQTEEIFFQGPLREALTALTDGNGIPLDGDGGDDFDEFNDDPSADTRGCFQPTPATNCIGFSWWLPTDHGNEVQSDSVAFDLGFYTEQCRHNDGSGMNNEAVSDDEVDA